MQAAEPLNPLRVFHELSERLPAMQMNGTNELIDIAHNYTDGATRGPSCSCSTTGTLTRSPGSSGCSPASRSSTPHNLLDFPFARYGELLGLRGIRVHSPDQVADAWDEALAADRPVVYEAITDPERPPLPPHIRMEQATSMAKALIGGDPNAGRIVKQSLKGKLAEFVNR